MNANGEPRAGGSDLKVRPACRWGVALACAVVFAACAIFLLPVLQEQQEKARSYERAEALLESGDYLRAQNQFERLGTYRDAPQRAREALEAHDAQVYEHAGEMLESGDYAGAAQAFWGLGSYRDASSKAEQARQLDLEQRYQLAGELAEAGDHARSAEVFYGLGDYADAASQADAQQWMAVAESPLGAHVRLGHVQGAAMEWSVVKRSDGDVLLVLDGIVPCPVDASGDAWESSSVRAWLNGPFLESNFTAGERACIVDADGDAVSVLTVDQMSDLLGEDARTCRRSWVLVEDGILGGRASYRYTSAEHYMHSRELVESSVGLRPAVWVHLDAAAGAGLGSGSN